jgi:hypothetical protein
MALTFVEFGVMLSMGDEASVNVCVTSTLNPASFSQRIVTVILPGDNGEGWYIVAIPFANGPLTEKYPGWLTLSCQAPVPTLTQTLCVRPSGVPPVRNRKRDVSL